MQWPAGTIRDRGDVAKVLSLLAREREVLEALLFTVEQQGPLLEDGAVPALRAGSAEVLELLDELRHLELLRAVVVAGLGIDADATLADVADACGGALGRLTGHHRTALLAIGSEVMQAARDNRVLLAAAVAERPALEVYAREVGYTPADLVPPSLRSFLGQPDPGPKDC